MNKLSHEKHQPKYIGQEMMEFLANTKFEDLPAEVVTRAKHIVMDAVAVKYGHYFRGYFFFKYKHTEQRC